VGWIKAAKSCSKRSGDVERTSWEKGGTHRQRNGGRMGKKSQVGDEEAGNEGGGTCGNENGGEPDKGEYSFNWVKKNKEKKKEKEKRRGAKWNQSRRE